MKLDERDSAALFHSSWLCLCNQIVFMFMASSSFILLLHRAGASKQFVTLNQFGGLMQQVLKIFF